MTIHAKGLKHCILRLNHQEWPGFVDVLASVRTSVAPNMRTDEEVDLGPAMLPQFLSWSRRLEKGQAIACQLQLRKMSDTGHSIKLGAPGIDYSWHEEAPRMAIDQAKMTKAAKQLRSAKEKGIDQAVTMVLSR